MNKKIICSLSLRGEEKHFLTSNYSQFLKILEQQVKQYSTQLSIKELIIKAVGDLPPERLVNEKSGFRKQEECCHFFMPLLLYYGGNYGIRY